MLRRPAVRSPAISVLLFIDRNHDSLGCRDGMRNSRSGCRVAILYFVRLIVLTLGRRDAVGP